MNLTPCSLSELLALARSLTPDPLTWFERETLHNPTLAEVVGELKKRGYDGTWAYWVKTGEWAAVQTDADRALFATAPALRDALTALVDAVVVHATDPSVASALALAKAEGQARAVLAERSAQ